MAYFKTLKKCLARGVCVSQARPVPNVGRRRPLSSVDALEQRDSALREPMVEMFDDIGVGQWFRYAIGGRRLTATRRSPVPRARARPARA